MGVNMNFNTFNEVVNYWAERSPNKQVFSFYQDLDSAPEQQTFLQFYRRVNSVASHLSHHVTKGDRVLLLYTPGLEFVHAFFACLRLGVIAVPAYPPVSSRKQQNVARLDKMVENCTPKLVLCDTKVSEQLTRLKSDSQRVDLDDCGSGQSMLSLPFHSTDEWSTTDIEVNCVNVTESDVAFLQYTSGSTGDPKGVMVTHANLIDNSNHLRRAFAYDESTIGVSWLPQYHDMGLIGSIMQPLYGGWLMHLFPPAQFVRKPLAWLECISKTKATISGAPNFAFEYCCDRLASGDTLDLDLSHWRVAYCGAEPIQNASVKRFSDTFSRYGYKERAFYPVFGMAEHTLICSAGPVDELYETLVLNRDKLIEKNEIELIDIQADAAKEFVSCGKKLVEHKIAIVDPATCEELSEGKVGEVWSHGASVAQGYWGNEALTEAVFHARTVQGDGPFLRTGDMGYLLKGNLYITGRLKDLIIIRGCNYAPQDIEKTVECSHEALRTGSAAAFSCDIDGVEKCVVVCELERSWVRKPHDEVLQAIIQAVSQQDRLEISRIVLTKPGAAFKTTSGKIQRRKTKATFLQGDITGVTVWSRDNGTETSESKQNAQEESIEMESFYITLMTLSDLGYQRRYLLQMMSQQLAVFLNLPRQAIDPQKNLFDLGMDSLGLVNFVNQIQGFFPASAEVNLYDVLLEEQDKTVENGLSLNYLCHLLIDSLFNSDSSQTQESEVIV